MASAACQGARFGLTPPMPGSSGAPPRRLGGDAGSVLGGVCPACLPRPPSCATGPSSSTGWHWTFPFGPYSEGPRECPRGQLQQGQLCPPSRVHTSTSTQLPQASPPKLALEPSVPENSWPSGEKQRPWGWGPTSPWFSPVLASWTGLGKAPGLSGPQYTCL